MQKNMFGYVMLFTTGLLIGWDYPCDGRRIKARKKNEVLCRKGARIKENNMAVKRFQNNLKIRVWTDIYTPPKSPIFSLEM